MRYNNVDQALNAINFESVSKAGGDLQNEVKQAFRPALTDLFQADLETDQRDKIVGTLIDSAIPSVLKTVTKHWSSVRAA